MTLDDMSLFNSFSFHTKKYYLKNLILSFKTRAEFISLISTLKRQHISIFNFFSYSEIYQIYTGQDNSFWIEFCHQYLKEQKVVPLSKNPLYCRSIQKNYQLYEFLLKITKLNHNTFLEKNYLPFIKVPPILLSEESFIFHDYLSWKQSLSINQLSERIFSINQKRFRKIIQKHLLSFNTKEQHLQLNEGSWLFFFLTTKLFGSLDETYHYLRNLSTINLSKQVIPLIQETLSNIDKLKSAKHFKKQIPFFLDLLLQPNLTSEHIEYISLIIKSWSVPILKYNDIFKST